MNVQELFRKARQKGVPLIVVRTADPAATIRNFAAIAQEQDGADTPVMHWNIVTGTEGFNDAGAELAKRLYKMPAFDPAGMCKGLANDQVRPADTLAFMQNAHLFWNEAPVKQAIWNLRDVLKVNSSTLVMTTTRGATVPLELAQDCLLLDEPLPTEEALRAIVTETYQNAEIAAPDTETLSRCTDALTGLPSFPAEQSAALCISKRNGMDLEQLWETKRQVVEQMKGLTVSRELITFDEIGGNQNAIDFCKALAKGRKRLRGVLIADEIEKSVAGFGTDTSGTTSKTVGTFLQWAQDKRILGMLFRGVSGSGKTAVSKGFGNHIGGLTIRLNLEAMEGALVGSTNEALRSALSTVDAMLGNDFILVGTMNRAAQMPAEMKSRFSLGTFFFDIPNEEEAQAIWRVYLKQYGLEGQELPKNRQNWTGREIEACCYKSWLLGKTLQESAAYVVPVALSEKEEIDRIRKEADGCFISASYPGPYRIPSETAKPSRRIKSDVSVAVTNLPNQTGEA